MHLQPSPTQVLQKSYALHWVICGVGPSRAAHWETRRPFAAPQTSSSGTWCSLTASEDSWDPVPQLLGSQASTGYSAKGGDTTHVGVSSAEFLDRKLRNGGLLVDSSVKGLG